MTNQRVIEIAELPEGPVDAAAYFLATCVPQIRELMAAGDVVIVFPPADHTHTGWRLSAVQELAREAAPCRVNAVAGDDAAAVAETLSYLRSAPGVTGQILTVDAIQDESD